MNTRVVALTVVTALLGFAGSASANELIVTPVASKAGQVSMAFDIVSSGDIAGFNFKVSMPGLVKKKGELASCVAELPKGFSGACSVQDGGIYVFATSDSPSVSLPAGVVSVGTVSVSYNAPLAKARGQSALTIEEFAFFDNKANPLAVKARIDTGLAGAK